MLTINRAIWTGLVLDLRRSKVRRALHVAIVATTCFITTFTPTAVAQLPAPESSQSASAELLEDYLKQWQLAVAAVSTLIAVASFFIARQADRRAKKAGDVRSLLGEKEEVAFGALKLLQSGLPKSQKDRALIISAVIQACLFSSSDRARALLYRVIEISNQQRQEFKEAIEKVEETFNSMDKYEFTKEELDLDRGKRRIRAVKKVVNSETSSVS